MSAGRIYDRIGDKAKGKILKRFRCSRRSLSLHHSVLLSSGSTQSVYPDISASCYSLSGITDIEAKISKMKEDMGIDCLLTGFSGGIRYQPVVRYQKVHALIDAVNLENAINFLGLKKVDSVLTLYSL